MKTSTNNIASNAIQILDEQKGDMTLRESHFYSKDNDPTYLTWLFGIESDIEDYGKGMNAEQKQNLIEFEASL